VSDGRKFGFVNSSGVVVIPFRYEDVHPFSDGLACVKIAGRWGFIDKTGRVVIQPSLEEAADFVDGFAAVFPVDTKARLLEGNFLNKAGKFVLLRHGYDAVIHYGDQLAWVSNFEFGQEYWRVIDRNQQWVSEKLTSCSLLPKYFSSGLAALQRTCDAKWGFVDSTGKQSIPAIFDDVRPFSEGLAAVKVAGKWGYISQSGQWISSAARRWCVRFSSVCGIGAACVCLRSGDAGCCCGRERSALCRAFSAVRAADRSHIRGLQSRVADGNGGVQGHGAAPSPYRACFLQAGVRKSARTRVALRQVRRGRRPLRTFPATCCADGKAPFLAVTKVASRKASSPPQ